MRFELMIWKLEMANAAAIDRTFSTAAGATLLDPSSITPSVLRPFPQYWPLARRSLQDSGCPLVSEYHLPVNSRPLPYMMHISVPIPWYTGCYTLVAIHHYSNRRQSGPPAQAVSAGARRPPVTFQPCCQRHGSSSICVRRTADVFRAASRHELVNQLPMNQPLYRRGPAQQRERGGEHGPHGQGGGPGAPRRCLPRSRQAAVRALTACKPRAPFALSRSVDTSSWMRGWRSAAGMRCTRAG